MGMVISGDILWAKVYDLIGDIEGVRTYIDAILCIGKGIETVLLDGLSVIKTLWWQDDPDNEVTTIQISLIINQLVDYFNIVS